MQEYFDFVASRFKTGEQCAEDADMIAYEAWERLHAAVGMLDEMTELMGAKTVAEAEEELGDVNFYGTAFVLAMGEAFKARMDKICNDADPAACAPSIMEMLVAAGAILGAAKKEVFFLKPCDEAMLDLYAKNMFVVVAGMETLAEIHGTDSMRVQEINRAKLTKRHPEGYTNEGQVAQADVVKCASLLPTISCTHDADSCPHFGTKEQCAARTGEDH